MGGIDGVLWSCLLYFAHTDHANAAIHRAPVRYSPITFSVANWLKILSDQDGNLRPPDDEAASLLETVLADFGAYSLDHGR